MGRCNGFLFISVLTSVCVIFVKPFCIFLCVCVLYSTIRVKTRPCRTKGRPPPACQPPQPSKNLSPLLSMPRAEPTSLPSPQPTPHLPEFPATSVPAGLGGPLPSLPHIFLCGASTPGGTLPDPIRTLTAWLGPCACAALWHML